MPEVSKPAPVPAAGGSVESERLRPEWKDMQGLILSAYPRLDQAAYLLYRIDDVAQIRRWLVALLPNVTTAFRNAPNAPSPDAPPRTVKDTTNVNIAFTWSGVRKLGISISKFSDAFVEGMAGQDHRSRILGDTGESDPAGWKWGNATNEVDLLLMVFAHNAGSLAAEVKAIEQSGAGALTRVWEVYGSPFSKMKGREHFGFADGVSQPILEGSTDAERFPDSIHLTALGEFVLGYPDAFGMSLGAADRAQRTSPLPTWEPMSEPDWVKVSHDPEPDWLHQQWDSFGRNGTYLVVRQLEQHVERFKKYVADASQHPYGDPESEYLAAKIVGRWRDGTPLVPYATTFDNEFGFAEDPHGYGCPMGSHVRRANPRDTFENNARLFRPRNDHRILRRGRSYGPLPDEPADGNARGLMFLCLNADLERQFEFIQQNWINNPAFAGLADETDPLVSGDGGGRDVFTIAGIPAPHRLCKLPRFVTVRGGQYFFLPGIKALKRLAGLNG